ncbi:MAG: transglycosylase family protein [Acidimicrobiales bacterium]
MSNVAQLVRPGGFGGTWFAKRTMAGIFMAIVLVAASAVGSVAPAGANQVGTIQNQMAALQAQVAAGAARVHALTVAYDQANIAAGTLAQQVGTDTSRIAQLEAQVDSSKANLKRQAILSYTGATATSNVSVLSGGVDPSVRAEYLQIASGDITDAVDSYRTQAGLLATARATLSRQEQASRTAASAAYRARQQALVVAGSEQAQLDSLQSQLDQLVRAAEVADRPAPPSPTQGLPVNHGLVSVVRAIVTPPSAAPAAPAPAPAYSESGGVWLQLRECESGDNYRENTGNGFYGAYQFSASTWTDLGYPGRPDLEPPSMQDQAAQKLQSEAGWGQWPACAAALGLR